MVEGYIGKPNSDPTIVLVSTPKAPGGLMQQIHDRVNKTLTIISCLDTNQNISIDLNQEMLVLMESE